MVTAMMGNWFAYVALMSTLESCSNMVIKHFPKYEEPKSQVYYLPESPF